MLQDLSTPNQNKKVGTYYKHQGKTWDNCGVGSVRTTSVGRSSSKGLCQDIQSSSQARLRVIDKKEEDTQRESSQYQSGEKRVQDKDVEQLLKRQRVP